MANSDDKSTADHLFPNDDNTEINAGDSLDSLGGGKHRDDSDSAFLSAKTTFSRLDSDSASSEAGSHRVSREEFTGNGDGSSAFQHSEQQDSSARDSSVQGDSAQHGYSQQGWQPPQAPFPKDSGQGSFGQNQNQSFNAGYGHGQPGQQSFGQNPGQGFQQGPQAQQGQQHGFAQSGQNGFAQPQQGYNQGFNQGAPTGFPPGHPAAGGQQGYPLAQQNQGYPAAPYQGYPGVVSDKTKLVAGLLALFLGGLGIHHFYNDNPMMGIGRIAVSVLCFIPFIGLIFLLADFVWWVADVIMAFTGNGPFKQDKYGRPLQ